MAHALRSLRRDPLLTASSVALLSLGIAAFETGWTTLTRYLSDPLPFTDATALVRIWSSHPQRRERGGVAGPHYLTVSGAVPSLSGVAAFGGHSSTLRLPTGDEPVVSASVSTSLFEIFRTRAQKGRLFAVEEDRVGAALVCLVSARLWRKVAGTTDFRTDRWIDLDGESWLIVGVLGDDFDFPSHLTELWMPLHTGPWGATVATGGTSFGVIGAMLEGFTLADLREELRRLPWSPPRDTEAATLWAESLEDFLLQPIRPALGLLTLAVFLVLMTAALNLGMLQIVRAGRLERETAIRVALGASTRRLMAPRMLEVLVTVVVAALLAIPLGRLLLGALLGMPHFSARALVLPTTSVGSIAVAAAIGAVAAVVSLAPLLRRPRPEALAVKSTSSSLYLGPWRRLATCELAISFIFLAAAALLVGGYRRVSAIDPGFDSSGLVAAYVDFPEPRYPFDPGDPTTWRDHHRRVASLLAEVRAIPGVAGAAVGTVHPLDPGWTARYSIGGGEPRGGVDSRIRTRWVSHDYFRITGAPVLVGREFQPDDALDAEPVAILNQRAARLLFPEESPIGRYVRVWDERERRVVGVVGDVHFLGVHQEAEPAIYAQYFQMPAGFCNIIVRTTLTTEELRSHLRGALDHIDPRIPLSQVRSIGEMLAEPLARARAGVSLASLIAAIVLSISAIGLYALMSASSAAWRAELGVRMVVGATRTQIVTLVALRGGRVLAAGMILGLLATLGILRLLVVLYSFSAGLTPALIVSVIAVSTALAFPALLLPALRASRLDPTAVLGRE